MAFVVGVVGLGLFAAGCASTGHLARDRAVENHLRGELDSDSELAPQEPDIQIVARDGAVTLIGPVWSERDRGRIVSLAYGEPGVSAVVDELQVTPPPTGVAAPYPLAPAPRTIPPGTPPAAAPVVVPGPAAVPGEYPTPRVRAATADDAPLAEQVINELRHDTVPAEWLQNVTITVRDGNVYLQGWVLSPEAHHAIFDSVHHCKGVFTVIDQLEDR